MINKNSTNNNIKGLIMLLVVASIIYMTAIIFMGTDDLISKLLTVPAFAFAISELVSKFNK
jgi:hypothetical protein